MRKKPWVDFYQLQAPVAALKNHGVTALEGVSLSYADWIYPAMSLWYWDIETVLPPTNSPTPLPALLAEDRLPENERVGIEIQSRGYHLCTRSSRYSLYVSDRSLLDACQSAVMKSGWIR
jgi:hypothetical protein